MGNGTKTWGGTPASDAYWEGLDDAPHPNAVDARALRVAEREELRLVVDVDEVTEYLRLRGRDEHYLFTSFYDWMSW